MALAMAVREAFSSSIKCSECGDQVDISDMGDHICRTRASGKDHGFYHDQQYHDQSQLQHSQKKISLPQIKPASNIPYIDPISTSSGSAARAQWVPAPITPLDAGPFGAVTQMVTRKPVQPTPLNTNSSSRPSQSGYAPPSPEDSPTLPKRAVYSDSDSSRPATRDGRPVTRDGPARDVLKRIEETSRQFGGGLGHPSLDQHSAQQNTPSYGNNETYDDARETGTYERERRPSTSQSNNNLRGKSLLDLARPGNPMIRRKESSSSIGRQEQSLNMTNTADQFRMKRSETAPMSLSQPCIDHQTEPSRTMRDRSPPHPVVGIPGNPSSTVSAHRRNKSSYSTTKSPSPPPTTSLPQRPLKHAASAHHLRGPSRVGSPNFIPPPMSAVEVPPPLRSKSRTESTTKPTPPPQSAYDDVCSGNPFDSPQLGHSTSYSTSSSSNFSGSHKSSASSLTTASEASDRAAPAKKTFSAMAEAREVALQNIQQSSPKSADGEPPRSHNRNASKHSYSTWEMEGLDRLQGLQTSTNSAESVPEIPPSDRITTTSPKTTANPPSTSDDTQHKRAPSSASTVSTRPRHTCRSCKLPITGRSIHSADGRLTGRFHKPCFVCTTCRAPFTSAEFYVLDDQPYCGRHYHELNRSLCATCDQGIEGRFREIEDPENFGEWKRVHVECFCCEVCGVMLAVGDDEEDGGEEYWEVEGRPWCERHAKELVERREKEEPEQQGQGLMSAGRANGLLDPHLQAQKVERRRTRLMFMAPGENPGPGDEHEPSSNDSHQAQEHQQYHQHPQAAPPMNSHRPTPIENPLRHQLPTHREYPAEEQWNDRPPTRRPSQPHMYSQQPPPPQQRPRYPPISTQNHNYPPQNRPPSRGRSPMTQNSPMSPSWGPSPNTPRMPPPQNGRFPPGAPPPRPNGYGRGPPPPLQQQHRGMGMGMRRPSQAASSYAGSQYARSEYAGSEYGGSEYGGSGGRRPGGGGRSSSRSGAKAPRTPSRPKPGFSDDPYGGGDHVRGLPQGMVIGVGGNSIGDYNYYD